MPVTDIKRFIDYLQASGPACKQQAEQPTPELQAADLDFETTLSMVESLRDDPWIQDVLMDGTGMVLKRALQGVQEQLSQTESQSISAYIQEAAPLNALHDQIRGCDQMLETVEGRLSHFDEELSTVNREIHSLERESDRLAIMLRNRTQAAERLGKWLEDTTLPPQMISTIRNADVTIGPLYSKALTDLRAKDVNMQAFVGHANLPAYPVLQALISTASERVKAFLLEKISSLKSTGTSATSNVTIRRQGLLAYQAYPAFLRMYAPSLYQAVVQRYIEDHRGYLSTSIRTYMAGLSAATLQPEKILLLPAHELATAARLGSMISSTLSGTAGAAPANEFDLGGRVEDLLHPDFSRWPTAVAVPRSSSSSRGSTPRKVHTYTPPALQTLGKSKLAPEYAFKALMHQLCDAAAGEFTFLEDFFGVDAAAVFQQCWQPILAMLHTDLDEQLASNHDVISLLVMTRIVGHCQLQMAHAHVPVLDAFLDKLYLMIWPHFSRDVRQHIASITNDKQDLKAKALKPAGPRVLPCVRRWTQLFIAIGKLNAEYHDSQVKNNLLEMARAMQTLLYRVRLLFPDLVSGCVFHQLNLHHIVTNCRAAFETPIRTLLSSELLATNSGGLGPDVMQTCGSFENDLDLAKKQYRAECLSKHVQNLRVYNNEVSKMRTLERPLTEAGDVDQARKIMQEFKDRWKQMVEAIRQEVHMNFVACEHLQVEMTRGCLEELYSTYKDFLAALNAQEGDYQALVKDAPTLQSLAYELRDMVR